MEEKKVISIEEIQKLAAGEIIDIPGWVPNTTISIRVRRIDITPQLLASGTLPNVLRSAAADQFKKDESEDSEKSNAMATDLLGDGELSELLPLIESVCRDAMVEPTFDEVQKIYPMILNQKMAIFSYITAEVAGLDSFRPKSDGSGGVSSNGSSVGLSSK